MKTSIGSLLVWSPRILGLAWHWPPLGGALFLLLALVYAISVPGRPDWILVIAGPLLLVGLLFLVSSRYQAS